MHSFKNSCTCNGSCLMFLVRLGGSSDIIIIWCLPQYGRGVLNSSLYIQYTSGEIHEELRGVWQRWEGTEEIQSFTRPLVLVGGKTVYRYRSTVLRTSIQCNLGGYPHVARHTYGIILRYGTGFRIRTSCTLKVSNKGAQWVNPPIRLNFIMVRREDKHRVV